MLDSARERLKPLFGTHQEVILIAASGTGAMEAAVTNLVAPGEHAIFVNGGKFGERWGRLLAAYGAVGHEVKSEWGRAVRPEQVEDAIKAHPEARAVFIQACETSSCAVHPVAEIGEVTRRRGVMLVVDGITSVGVFEQQMDAWSVDALVTGSQKALMLPPGLAMIALSPRGLERTKQIRTPRYYFDLMRELKAQSEEHTTAYTPAVSLVFGLNKSLDMIHAETLPRVFARHRLMAEATRSAAQLVRHMRDELGVTVQGGQDHMKGKLVRIGHMGYMGPFDMLVAVGALEMALGHFGYRFEPGAGVAAVQTTIARGV